MAGVRGAVGQLFQEDGLWELDARLKGRPEIEVEADVGMIAILDSTHFHHVTGLFPRMYR